MEQHRKRNRMLTLALVFCLSAVLALSTLFVITHASHNCTGEDCQVCRDIENCLALVQFLWQSAGSAAGGAAAVLSLLFYLIVIGTALFRSPATLVALKIRLNN